MTVEGVSSVAPKLNPSFFYVDRVWIKFLNPRYATWRGVDPFAERITENAFDVYRLLVAIKNLRKRGSRITEENIREWLDEHGYDISFSNYELPKDLGRFLDFYVTVNGVDVPVTVIETIKLNTWIIHEARGTREIKYLDFWWRYGGVDYHVLMLIHQPFTIRLLFNAIEYAKRKLRDVGKLNEGVYDERRRIHDNWFIPECGDFDLFLRYNREVFEDTVRHFEFAKMLCKVFYGDRFDVSGLRGFIQGIELSYDFKGNVIDYLGWFRIGGRNKKLHFDSPYEQFKRYVEEGKMMGDNTLKFYMDLKRGFQFKLYQKAIGVVRVEFTLSRYYLSRKKNKYGLKMDDYSEVGLGEYQDLIREKVDELNRTPESPEFLPSFKAFMEFMARLISVGKGINKDLHVDFLTNLFLSGSVMVQGYKGIWRRYYKRGLVELEGRGRYAVVKLTPELDIFRREILEFYRRYGFDVEKIETTKTTKPMPRCTQHT